MDQVHPNYIKAYKLILLAFAIDCVSLIKSLISIFTISDEIAASSLQIDAATNASLTEGYGSSVMIAIIIVCFYYGIIAHFIRKGTTWVKYFLLVVLLLGTLSLLYKGLPDEVSTWFIIETAINVITKILTVWVLVLLFRAPKSFPLTDGQTVPGIGENGV